MKLNLLALPMTTMALQIRLVPMVDGSPPNEPGIDHRTYPTSSETYATTSLETTGSLEATETSEIVSSTLQLSFTDSHSTILSMTSSSTDSVSGETDSDSDSESTESDSGSSKLSCSLLLRLTLLLALL